MRDFTYYTYKNLLNSIIKSGYSIQTMEDFIIKPKEKVVVLRHDCDLWPNNDLKMALIEFKLGIRATYYFRMPYTFNIKIIKRIKELNHEIGYHYENLAEFKGDYSKSIEDFKVNLKKLRSIYPVKTIVMHGRPLSKWDGKLLWKKYNYKNYGIIAEPYLSVNYDEVLYLTDTGNMWNGHKVSIRDTVNSKMNYDINSTFDLIQFFEKNKLPNQIIINSHADRWNDNYIVWLYKDILQKLKNFIKRGLKIIRN